MHGGLSHFKALIRRRKELSSQKNPRSKKSKYGSWESSKPLEFNNPELTEFELKKRKDKIRKNLSSHYRKQNLVSVILVSTFVLIIVYLFIKYG